MPEYTEDYFSKRIPAWETLLFGSLGWDPKARRTAVEIGSFEGRSAVWMVENLLQHPESELHCIDHWPGVWGEERFRLFSANICELDGRAKVKVMRHRSEDALMALRARKAAVDFVYIDGSHAAADVLSDLVLSFRITQVGGVLLCDDYLWQGPKGAEGDITDRPKLAIDAFTNCYADKIRILHGMPLYQIAFQKTAL